MRNCHCKISFLSSQPKIICYVFSILSLSAYSYIHVHIFSLGASFKKINSVIYSQWSCRKTHFIYVMMIVKFFIQRQIIHFSIRQNGSLFMISLVLYRFCSFYLRIRRYDAIFSHSAQIIIPHVIRFISIAQIYYVYEKSSLTPGPCPVHFFLTCQSLPWKIHV